MASYQAAKFDFVSGSYFLSLSSVSGTNTLRSFRRAAYDLRIQGQYLSSKTGDHVLLMSYFSIGDGDKFVLSADTNSIYASNIHSDNISVVYFIFR